ncbi:unnamed protein product [Rotaria magnacalcarata]|uniref:Uncharacterized protein n=4 Tax=Rotaria magnacalcarata TaxID=392030 RepID=A0A815L7T6_9BILA|nr:unnamed protein product [Rotaria magnacalcarata]CAF1986117.1 unnamed protein product [Rotaria magnacalcarata]CAF2078475.1 unnamed protein product [Rotaria magnacalcarata]CAF4071576.1 unnamed protein product [Rotaria magnacalcarata]CAF4149712.1 unnamed protein product [Rotaria magnacalcarata]
MITIAIDHNDLLAKLSHDHVSRKNIDESDLSVSFHNNTDKSHTSLNGNFLWLQLYLEVLLRMEPSASAKAELVQICRKYYQGNDRELIKVEKFDQTYVPSDAVTWYTRDCFIYRLINKALRVQDINLLFAFRFLILDIFNQLRVEKSRLRRSSGNIIQCYRGQMITEEELNQMRSNIGCFISVNSFLSTTQDRNLAVVFASSLDDIYEKLLFEIEADMCLLRAKPFADVTHLSIFDQEKEILFMCGAIFQIKNITKNEAESLWIIQLKLCDDTNSALKELFDYQKQKMAETTDLISLGKLLREMGELTKAKQYYEKSLSELPLNNSKISICYYGLGVVLDRECNYDDALDYFRKALDFETNVLSSSNTAFMGKIYGSIGIVYYNKHCYGLALEYLMKSLNILLDKVGYDHGDTAMVFTNLGRAYQAEKNYDLALQNHVNALNIKLKILPPDHPRLARSYVFIGNVYADKQEFDLAFANYQNALNIQLKSLPDSSISIGVTFHRIGQVCVKTGKYQSAVENFRRADHIYKLSLPSNHQRLLQLKLDCATLEDHMTQS